MHNTITDENEGFALCAFHSLMNEPCGHKEAAKWFSVVQSPQRLALCLVAVELLLRHWNELEAKAAKITEEA
jgi:hypothetical protein